MASPRPKSATLIPSVSKSNKRKRDRWAPVRYSRDVGLVYVDRLPEVGHPNRVYTLFGERTVWRWLPDEKRWDCSINPDYVWAEYEVSFWFIGERNPGWVIPVLYRSENTPATEPGSLTFAQIQSAVATMKKFEVDLGSPIC